MSVELRQVTSIDVLDELVLGRSRPVVIFKHSVTCGTSAFAHEEILDLLASVDEAVDAYVVDVRAHPLVSAAIARRFKIRHESPQVLLVADGRVIWSASHYGVTAAAILQKVRDWNARPRLATASGRGHDTPAE